MPNTPNQAAPALQGVDAQRIQAFDKRLQQILEGGQKDSSVAVIEALLATNTDDKAKNVEFGRQLETLFGSNMPASLGMLAGTGMAAKLNSPKLASDLHNFNCLQTITPVSLHNAADHFTGMMGLDAKTNASAGAGIQAALQGVDESRMTRFVANFENAQKPGVNPIDATITALRASSTGDARADAKFARQIQGAFAAVGQTFTSEKGGLGEHNHRMLETCAEQVGSYAAELDGQRQPVAGTGRSRNNYAEARPAATVTPQGGAQTLAPPRTNTRPTV